MLMRARRALGVAELAGRDGRMIGPGCRTVMADRQRLLEQRGPSMEFAPMEVRFAVKRKSSCRDKNREREASEAAGLETEYPGRTT